MLPNFSTQHLLRETVKAVLLLLLLICIVAPSTVCAEEEYEYDTDFDIPKDKASSPFEFWGQAELRTIARSLNKDSAQYKQRFYKTNQEKTPLDFRLQIKPEISWNKEDFSAYLRPRLEIGWSQMPLTSSAPPDEPSELLFKKDKNWAGKVLAEEAFVSWQPTPTFSFETGKKVLKWGKGYAWNPVSFISRQKDVNDPDRSREGYVLAYADSITSLDGPINTIAFTPVISMVNDNINTGLADGDSILVGGKAYILAYDTDVDLLFMAGDKYDTRFGIDFATNLSENFAIHGESSLRLGFEKETIDSAGAVSRSDINAWSLLLGARYLTETDTTYIAEYYHNGEGYSQSEMRKYFTLIDDGYDQYSSTGTNTLLKQSSKVGSAYNKSSNGRDYLYLRASQKEPFDILYLTPTLTTIINIGDGSFSLNPEVSYMASTSLEIKPRLVIPIGPAKSEFGEKLNRINAELRFTYFY